MRCRAESAARSRFAAAALAALLAAGCTSDPPTEPLIPVLRVVISGAPADGVMLLASSRQLTVVTLGPDDVPLEDREVHWSSSASEIATVNGEGRVETDAVGDVEIRATSDGVTEALPLSVREGTTVPAQGNTRRVTLLDGLLHLAIRVGSAPGGTIVHARVAVTWPPNARIVPGTVVEIGPVGTELAEEMVTGVEFVPTAIPADERDRLRLFGVDATGQWVELAGPNVDLDLSLVEADVMRLTTVAIFRPAATP